MPRIAVPPRLERFGERFRGRETYRRLPELHQTSFSSPEKTIEVFVLPTTCPLITVKLLFSAIKLGSVNPAPASLINLFGNNRVEHFVIDHVFQKPSRYERCIQKRMNADDSVFLLDCAEDEIFLGRQSSTSAPSDGVSFEGVVEILGVQFVENRLEIEVFALVKKLKLPLEWKPFYREFPLCLSHKKKCLKSREQIRAGNQQKCGSLKSSRGGGRNCVGMTRFLGNIEFFRLSASRISAILAQQRPGTMALPGKYGISGSLPSCRSQL